MTDESTKSDRLVEPWLTPARLLALVAVVVGAYGAIVVFRALQGVLVMLLVSLFLSFAMEPAVQFLARRGWRRGLATAAVFLALFLITGAVIAAMTPLIVSQVQGLIRSVPRSLDQLNQLLATLPFGIDLETSPELRQELLAFSNEFGDRLRDVALGAAGNVVGLGATVFGLIARILAIGLITFYLVADGPRFRRTLARPLSQERQREMLALWEVAVAKTGGYIYSRLLIAVASAVAHGLFLMVLGIPFPLPLGIWMGLTTAFVPVVGAYLGGILLLLVAVVQNPVDALWVLVFVTVYQQVENYLIAPKVQAQTMDLHPAVAFLSVIVGASLMGAVGALLALPAAAITKALLQSYVHRHQLIAEFEELAAGEIEEGEPPREESTPQPSMTKEQPA